MPKCIYAWQHRLAGEVIGEIRRFPKANGKKEDIPFYRKQGDDFGAGAPPQPRPLIGLDSYHDVVSPVIICEGQKKQQAWASLGFQTVACIGGSNAAHLTDWSPLAGARKVYFAPDNDSPGEKFIQEVWAQLAKYQPRFNIVRLKGLKKAEDVCDWLKRLPELEDWNEYDALANHPEREAIATKLWDAVENNLHEIPGSWQLPEEWSEPESLIDPLGEITRMTPEMLPSELRTWAQDITYRMQCPLEYIAVAAVIMAGAAIGARVGIRPKRVDNWTEYANIWGVVCGPPATLKSPALKEAILPLVAIDSALFEEYEVLRKQYEADKTKYDMEMKAFKDAASGKSKYSKVAEDIKPEKPDEPLCKRFVANDTTVEAMAKLFAENPDGLLLFQDELTTLLSKWSTAEHASDRPFYLQSWSGNGTETIDRIGRGQLRVKNMCLSILGGMQPDTVRTLLVNSNEMNNDGLLQRFQMTVYISPQEHSDFKIVDCYPNYDARDAVSRLIKDLTNIDFKSFGAVVDRGSDKAFFRFDEEAQCEFFKWLKLIAEHTSEEPNDAIKQHLGKFKKLCPTLALIFHCLKCVNDRTAASIGLDSLKLAIVWCDVLEQHARRIYNLSAPKETTLAHELSKHILAGSLKTPFAVRDVLKKNWRKLNKRENVDAALRSLVENNWLRTVILKTGPTGGPPRIEYQINPKVKNG